MTRPRVTDVTPPYHRITLDPFAGDSKEVFLPDLVAASLQAVPAYPKGDEKR